MPEQPVKQITREMLIGKLTMLLSDPTQQIQVGIPGTFGMIERYSIGRIELFTLDGGINHKCHILGIDSNLRTEICKEAFKLLEVSYRNRQDQYRQAYIDRMHDYLNPQHI